MKEHACSCSFVFAVFNNFNKTRVRVRSCSTFSKKSVFVFVRVQYFTEILCSCSFVFDTLEKIRVRVRSCSVFSRKLRVRVLFVFMFVHGLIRNLN